MKAFRPWRRFYLALAAVVLGNAVYFSLSGFLPASARHTAFRLDLGLIIDFWLCLVIFNLLLALFRSKH
jgi:hypothetical protein